MIQPDEIRQKAERLYPVFLKAWLDGDGAFFPRAIPASKNLDSADLAGAATYVRQLREGSREVLGFGYTVEWKERRSRAFGLNRFPMRIVFETQDDFLRFINRRAEFAKFVGAVTRLREEFPILDGWIRLHRRLLIDAAENLDGLLHVLRYFRDHPSPNRFARELPIPVDTKFIGRHERVLREWLDLVLPPHAIRADERRFERRYGLRCADGHWLIRFLDDALQVDTGFPCSEFSIPLQTLADLSLCDVKVVVVENKVNLLTLPPLPRTLALGGVGRAATELRDVPWLRQVDITYWGDIDVEGFNILSAWRVLFPQTKSMFMDYTTLDRFGSLVIPGTGSVSEMPPHLTDDEQSAFLRCHAGNLRLEQERLPQAEILSAIDTALNADHRTTGEMEPAVTD
jgi:hypothetical protein